MVQGILPRWLKATLTPSPPRRRASLASTANEFAFDTTGFSNPIKDVGIFRAGNDLFLTFTAIPEPSTYAVAIGALLGGIILLRRRSRLPA